MAKNVNKLHRRLYGLGCRLRIGSVELTYTRLAKIRNARPIIRDDVFSSELFKVMYEK